MRLFKSFSVICGLALQKSFLMDTIRKKQNQLEISNEMMSYHSRPHIDEVNNFIETLPLPRFTINEIKEISFDSHILDNSDDQLVIIVLQMFKNLGYCEAYHISEEKCLHYILTVRKNYRKVAYHNFTHAVSVTHSIFLLITHTSVKTRFPQLNQFGMFLAALNHDIDHRGTNNAFQKTAQTALARYYSTSTMEKHHFNHAIHILQTLEVGMCDAFENERYKLLLSELEKSIMATDLELYFRDRDLLKKLIDNNEFDWNNPNHFDLGRGIIMTCSDLGGMTKPFKSSRFTTDAV